MRNLSNALLAEIYGQQSSVPFLLLLTIEHPTSGSIRLVNNTADITSRGNVFSAFPMKITLPTDDGKTEKEVSLELDNVSLELISELRTVTSPMPATIEAVLSNDPDSVEIELGELKIGDISYDSKKISARLYLDDFLNTGLSSEKYTPTLYPGLFS